MCLMPLKSPTCKQPHVSITSLLLGFFCGLRVLLLFFSANSCWLVGLGVYFILFFLPEVNFSVTGCLLSEGTLSPLCLGLGSLAGWSPGASHSRSLPFEHFCYGTERRFCLAH